MPFVLRGRGRVAMRYACMPPSSRSLWTASVVLLVFLFFAFGLAVGLLSATLPRNPRRHAFGSSIVHLLCAFLVAFVLAVVLLTAALPRNTRRQTFGSPKRLHKGTQKKGGISTTLSEDNMPYALGGSGIATNEQYSCNT